MRTSHVILDRDGVLNEEAPEGGYVRSPAEWRWIPGALEALAAFAAAGVRVSLATNQSGVGRGVMTSADLDAVHAHMLEDVYRAGAAICGIFVCPHTPSEGCNCRKPAAGLIRAALQASETSASETLVVGDDLRDIEAARAAGVASALVLTGKGRSAAAQLREHEVPVYDDLRAVARQLVETAGHTGRQRQ